MFRRIPKYYGNAVPVSGFLRLVTASRHFKALRMFSVTLIKLFKDLMQQLLDEQLQGEHKPCILMSQPSEAAVHPVWVWRYYFIFSI